MRFDWYRSAALHPRTESGHSETFSVLSVGLAVICGRDFLAQFAGACQIYLEKSCGSCGDNNGCDGGRLCSRIVFPLVQPRGVDFSLLGLDVSEVGKESMVPTCGLDHVDFDHPSAADER